MIVDGERSMVNSYISPERCYIIDLVEIKRLTLIYIFSKWINTNHDATSITNVIHNNIDSFILGTLQAIAQYYSGIDNKTQSNIEHLIDLIGTHYVIHNKKNIEDGVIAVRHLKKLIEDYVITQLIAAMNNHEVFNPTVTRYGICEQDNSKFFICCQ